jgi:hypothetical protein
MSDERDAKDPERTQVSLFRVKSNDALLALQLARGDIYTVVLLTPDELLELAHMLVEAHGQNFAN